MDFELNEKHDQQTRIKRPESLMKHSNHTTVIPHHLSRGMYNMRGCETRKCGAEVSFFEIEVGELGDNELGFGISKLQNLHITNLEWTLASKKKNANYMPIALQQMDFFCWTRIINKNRGPDQGHCDMCPECRN